MTLVKEILKQLGENDTFGEEPDRDGDVNLEGAPFEGVFNFIIGKIERKPAQAQAALFKSLLNSVMTLAADKPAMKTDLIKALKAFKAENF